MRDVTRLREHMVQRVTEFVRQRLELGVVEPLAIEIGDEHRVRLALRELAGRANAVVGRVAVLSVARKKIEIEAADVRAGLRDRWQDPVGPRP